MTVTPTKLLPIALIVLLTFNTLGCALGSDDALSPDNIVAAGSCARDAFCFFVMPGRLADALLQTAAAPFGTTHSASKSRLPSKNQRNSRQAAIPTLAVTEKLSQELRIVRAQFTAPLPGPDRSARAAAFLELPFVLNSGRSPGEACAVFLLWYLVLLALSNLPASIAYAKGPVRPVAHSGSGVFILPVPATLTVRRMHFLRNFRIHIPPYTLIAREGDSSHPVRIFEPVSHPGGRSSEYQDL